MRCFPGSNTIFVTFKVPQSPTSQHDSGPHDNNLQLACSMHHLVHEYNDFDILFGASTWRYIGPIPSHVLA